MLRLPKPKVVLMPKEMLKLLLDPDWRQWPMKFDVPAESQIFGHLVHLAGIDGIALFP